MNQKAKGIIGILTGGGDVPGLNPAIRAVTIRALREGYKVIGIRRGWKGLVDVIRDKKVDNSCNYFELTEEIVNKAGRTGGTFLHSSRTRASHVPQSAVPEHLKDKYNAEINDLTPEVLKNLEFIGIDYLIPIGGDDTLSYAVRLSQEGVKVVAIPKTMDNDVPGTDYCIGFSTCITRTIELTHDLRTCAGSHERLLVLEVFGRYAGFSAMLPTLAGAANRCVIPEYQFDIERLAELLCQDRYTNPSKYSVVLVSEGASYSGGQMMFQSDEGETINVINQKLGYLVRCGNPDAMDSIVPMAYGNLALDLISKGMHGRLVILRNGRYDNAPIDIVTSSKKLVDINKFYNTDRLRPQYNSFEFMPQMIL